MQVARYSAQCHYKKIIRRRTKFHCFHKVLLRMPLEGTDQALLPCAAGFIGHAFDMHSWNLSLRCVLALFTTYTSVALGEVISGVAQGETSEKYCV